MARISVLYFCTLSHKRNDFRKKVTEIKCAFWCSLKRLSGSFFVLRRNERGVIKCILVFMYGACCWCQILTKLDFCRQIVEKMLKYQVAWKSPSSGSRVVTVHTDRRTWRSWWFSNFANAPVKCKVLNSHGGVEDSSLSSSLDGGQWSAWSAGRLNPWRGRRCPLSAPHSRSGGF